MVAQRLAQISSRGFTDLFSTPSMRTCVEIQTKLQSRLFTQSRHLAGRRATRERPHFRDAYTIKQEEARQAANIARSAETKARRAEAAGDPIRGAAISTPFVQSFDLARDPIATSTPPVTESQPEAQKDASAQAAARGALGQGMDTARDAIESPKEAAQMQRASVSRSGQLNHFLTSDDLDASLDHSKRLAAPYASTAQSGIDVGRAEMEQNRHELQHAVRCEAVSRILAPENASSDQRTIINTQRCIQEFGRHNTDAIFRRQEELGHGAQDLPTTTRYRAGPDTGSSEVQIAILTAKIRVLVSEFEGRSRNDKVNKRNLRLLLHRRQKLLKYFEKKDRGGMRWRHLLETLGLTGATWKGEINVR